jgi:hypothetical protein
LPYPTPNRGTPLIPFAPPPPPEGKRVKATLYEYGFLFPSGSLAVRGFLSTFGSLYKFGFLFENGSLSWLGFLFFYGSL